MSNSETHTVSMPSSIWRDIDSLAESEHTSRSAVILDGVKCKLSDNDDKKKRLPLFNLVVMLLLFVIILLLMVVIL